MLLKIVKITSETTGLKNAWNGNQTILNENGISLDTNWSNRRNLIYERRAFPTVPPPVRDVSHCYISLEVGSIPPIGIPKSLN
jgi:hypothetical protein